MLLSAATLCAQPPQGGRGGPAQQLMRQGKLTEALAVYQEQLKTTPDSVPANSGAGIVLDLMGKGSEARKYFQKAIDVAPDAAAKANAHRAMAMSHAFSGDCGITVKYEQMVFDFWKTRESAEPGNAFYQEGEMANEAARVCIDAGDLDTAAKWYQKGHDAGIREPADLHPGRQALWEYRTEHALARIAARRGNKAEAQQHVALAKKALEDIKAKDAGLYAQQQAFLPYLTGYVALYVGDYKAALDDLQKTSASDPFFQCLIGMTYEKLGDQDKAMEAYRKAAASTGHNPPAAFAIPFAKKKLGSA
ncbi:MAG: tetratricopeptide repeat protein [Acidobacteriia bacterium]|nr:tetratricopeptide repeat protein [Terriglobia bacterium]